MGLEGNGLVASAEVQTSHIKTDPRAYTRCALRRARPRWLAGLKFEPKAVGKGIAVGLPHLDENIFLRIGPFGILHRRIHLAENAEVVEFGLRIQKILLAQRIAFVNLDF